MNLSSARIFLDLFLVGSHALTSITVVNLKQSVIIQSVGMSTYLVIRLRKRSSHKQLAWIILEAWFTVSIILTTISCFLAWVTGR